jgi:hypothetical protein
MSDKEKGLYGKYFVERKEDVKGKHRDCEFFVLDLNHDVFAPAALEAYATACHKKYPKLAGDLLVKALESRLAQTLQEAVKPAANPPKAIEPVDRSARDVVGSAIAKGIPDTSLLPDGQQKGYVVLSAAERAKGFVRPVRRSYVHEACGTQTTMGLALAETYSRSPDFYSGTYCAACNNHFPVGKDGEFRWSGTNEKVGT